MSYRLIDSNAIAEEYEWVNDMPCIYADLPHGLDGNYHGNLDIVHCSDCKYRKDYGHSVGCGVCSKGIKKPFVSYSWYCADGEMKTE